jgi:hypothetical protein
MFPAVTVERFIQVDGFNGPFTAQGEEKSSGKDWNGINDGEAIWVWHNLDFVLV